MNMTFFMQSSCTTPNLEAESARIQNMQVISQPKCVSASNVSNTMIECLEECARESVIERSEIEGMSPCLHISSSVWFSYFYSLGIC